METNQNQYKKGQGLEVNTYKNKDLNKFYIKKIKSDPINQKKISFSEVFLEISESNKKFFLFSKKEITKILYIFPICAFLCLLKNGHSLEAKFLINSFCVNLFCNSKNVFLNKICLLNDNKIKKESLLKFLQKKRAQLFNSSLFCKNFFCFSQKDDLSNIYKNLDFLMVWYKMFRQNIIKKSKFKIESIFKGKTKHYTFKTKRNYMKNLGDFVLNTSRPENPGNPKFFKFVKIHSDRPNLINCIDLSFDEKTMAIGYQNSLIHVYNLLKNKPTKKAFLLKGHDSSIFCAKKLKFGNFILSGSIGAELYLWALKKKALVLRYQLTKQSVWDFSFTKNGESFLSVGSAGFSAFWHIERPFPVRLLMGHLADTNVVKWHPNANFLATGSDDKTVRLWDIRVKKSIGKIIYGGKVNSLEFNQDGSKLFIAGTSSFVDVLETRTLKSCFRINEGIVQTKIDKLILINKEDFGYVKNSSIVKLWNNQKKEKFYSENNDYKNFVPYKIIPSIERIFQMKINKFNKITIVGLC